MSNDKAKKNYLRYLRQRYLFWRDIDENIANFWLKEIEKFNKENKEVTNDSTCRQRR